MKILLKTTLIIYIFSFGKVFSQKENLNQTKYQFAKNIFEKEYSKSNFEKFKGKIEPVNKNTIKFDEKTLIIPNLKEEFKFIFTNGIFHPNIIFGNHITKLKTKEELDKMNSNEKMFYNMSRTDSLTIGNFEELSLLNPNHKNKRFLVWIYTKGMMNPTEYYIELQNKKARRKTKLYDFIKNSKLTFCKKGTIII